MSRFLHLLFFSFTLHSARAENVRDTILQNSLLYSGTEYVKQFNNSKGSPFFPSEFNRGRVKYHGNWYGEIELFYDCEDDLVIVRDLQGQLKLQLVREKLDEFVIDGHHFIRLKILSNSGEFYEKLKDGRRILFVQWEKRLNTNMKETDQYVLKRSLFIMEDGKIIKIDRVTDLFSVSPGRQKEIRKIYKDSNLDFRKDPLGTSVSMLKYIEEKGW